MIIPEHLKKDKNESQDDYLIRLFDNKEEYDIDNYTIANLMNKASGESYSESKWRKDYAQYVYWTNYYESKKGSISPADLKYKESHETKSDGTQVSDKLVMMSDEDKKNPDFLLKAHGYDPEEWSLTSSRNNIWNSYSKQDGIMTLYSSKITVKPKIYELNIDEIKEDIKELMKNYSPPVFQPVRHKANGKMLEVNVSDLHLNKMGYTDGVYDSEIAESRFFHILNDVITRTENLKFEKILFVWSHDFFNIDTLTKTTTAGTQQDVNMHFANMYKKGKRMLIKGIDLLSSVAPVETVQVGANHDRLTSYTMSEVLSAWYKENKNVTIDNDPLRRKYVKFGRCLIGFSHGDKEKKRLGKIMPVEARKAWGETLYSEIHAAHLHSEQAVKEENGTIVRYLSTLSGTDMWHFDSGYVGAIPKAQSFIWDKELGLTDIIHTPIVPNYSNLVKEA